MLGVGEYDVLLTDINMPEMDGFELSEKIREGEKVTGKHLPIIAMTALAFEEDRKRCLEVGMDGYVSKPIRREELIKVLNANVDRGVG